MAKLTPTEIASYVRLQCCDRYLWNLAEKSRGEGTGGGQSSGENGGKETQPKPTLDPYLDAMGKQVEKEFAGQLEKILKCKGKGLGECLTKLLCKPDINWWAQGVEIKGTIAGVQITGKIDFLVGLSGKVIIIECKASTQDKTYQRIQAAVYSLLLKNKLDSLQCGNEAPNGKSLEIEVLVVRRSAATGQLHTYIINGAKFVLEPKAQGNVPDDSEGNLPQPNIDSTELSALQADVVAICEKFAKYDDPNNCAAPAFQLLPRCHDCEFNEKCLKEACDRAGGRSSFGYEILGYGAKAKKAFPKNKSNSLTDIRDSSASIFPPPAKLVPARIAYYALAPSAAESPEVVRLEGPVPQLPLPAPPENGDFFQFFLCVEGDSTKPGKLAAVSLLTVKHSKNSALIGKTYCWTKFCGKKETNAFILEKLAMRINKEVAPSKSFYAHFYFWSLEEKKLLAQACEHYQQETEGKSNECVRDLLHWISRHDSLREPPTNHYGYYELQANGLPKDCVSSDEELVCSHLSQEIRRCFALGSIGATLLEVSCLRWRRAPEMPTNSAAELKNASANVSEQVSSRSYRCWEHYWCPSSLFGSIRATLQKRMIFSDTLPPSQWWDRNAEETPEPALLNEPELTLIKSHFQRRVTVLQQMEEHIRTVEFYEDEFERDSNKPTAQGHFENLTKNKIVNSGFPTFKSEELIIPASVNKFIVPASRNMLLIDTIHRKDRWLKEVTEGFHSMPAEGRSAELVKADGRTPAWRRLFPQKDTKVVEVVAFIPLDDPVCNDNDKQVIQFLRARGNRLVDVELVVTSADKSWPSLSDSSRTSWPESVEDFKEVCRNVHNDCQKGKTGKWKGKIVCDDIENTCSKLYHLVSLQRGEAEQPAFSCWQSFNRRILEAIEDRRDKLNLGTACRLVALSGEQSRHAAGPNKWLLENGTISCGPVRWQFWKKTAYHYLHRKNETFMADNVPIVCGPGKFYIYNIGLNAVLVRLTPAVRNPHLTVPSAWRKLDKYSRDQNKKHGWMIDEPFEVDQVEHARPVFADGKQAVWIVADCETYREMPILRGLSQNRTPSLLKRTFSQSEKP